MNTGSKELSQAVAYPVAADPFPGRRRAFCGAMGCPLVQAPSPRDVLALGPLPVLPERQGLGIGTQLLRRFCQEVDQAGAGAYLETDKPENVRLYERFSFRVTVRETLFGVVNWFMWRAPALQVYPPLARDIPRPPTA